MSIKQLTPDERRERLIGTAKRWRAKILGCDTYECARKLYVDAQDELIVEADKLFSIGGGYYVSDGDAAEEMKKNYFASAAEAAARNIVYDALELAKGLSHD